METGILYGIGIGPGDPELLTLKGRRLLEEADAIFVPKSELEGESLALSVIADLVDASKVVELVFPMAKDEGVLRAHWSKAAEAVCERLERGEKVAFVTLGDPSLYSTFNYLRREIELRWPSTAIEIVPGISAPSAAAARLGRSLSEGRGKVAVVPAPDDASELGRYVAEFETVVVMKIGRRFGDIARFLKEKGMLGSASLVQRLGTPEELVIPSLEGADVDPSVGYLSTLIIKRNTKRQERPDRKPGGGGTG